MITGGMFVESILLIRFNFCTGVILLDLERYSLA
jgi:hypothetical protein